MSDARSGVSFIVPVHNGERWLRAALESILAQQDGRPMEVIVVDDGSTDGSAAILATFVQAGSVRLLRGSGLGSAAAINMGVRHALHPIICQVDQDVMLRPAWMPILTKALDDPLVAAAQGYYETPPGANVWSRAAGLDLELRFHDVQHLDVDQVCTGNTAYRADALRQCGLFDEDLGYGYDPDISYRLLNAGYRLVFCKDARAQHQWREGPLGYLRQQFGQGYGRLDLVQKHRRQAVGNDISPLGMILHAAGMTAALAALATALVAAIAGLPARPLVWIAVGVIALLALERLVAGIQAWRRFGETSTLWFPVIHLLRDLAWALAIVVWTSRIVTGRRSRPHHSMRRGAR